MANERGEHGSINLCIRYKGTKITINTSEGEQSEESIVANSFNKLFVDKIGALKEAIDPARVKDPLEKIGSNLF